MQRLERLFAINDALRRAAPGRLSAADLATEFGVSRRTIERDLASLRAAGVPLYAEYGRTGGQITLDRMGSVVVSLTPSQVTALLIAVKAAGPGMPYADAAAEAVKQLLDGLSPATRVAVDGLRSRIRTKVVDDDPKPVKRRVRRSVEAAVNRNVVLNIRYTDRSGATTDRSVDPVGFYQGNDGWFLIGWCHLRTAGRVFRLDRIERANMTRRSAAVHDVEDTLGWTPNELEQP